MDQQYLQKLSMEGKNADKKSDFPAKIQDLYFDIQLGPHRQLKKCFEEKASDNQLIRRPVGRPPKNPKTNFSLIDVVKKESMDLLHKWIYDYEDQEVRQNQRRRRPPGQNDNEHYRTRRQRGYKKNMAIPLIDILLRNPIGYTTRDFTEKILNRMEGTNNTESQDKMRRRIYQFLMVMKTVGVIFSEEDPIPFISHDLAEQIKDHEIEDYFSGIDKFVERKYQKEDLQEDLRLENLKIQDLSIHDKKKKKKNEKKKEKDEKKKARKQYNMRKGLNVGQFLSTPCLIKNYLGWKADKVKGLEELVQDLKALKSAKDQQFRSGQQYYVKLIGRQHQENLKVKFIIDSSDPHRPKKFIAFNIDGDLLSKGDVHIKKGLHPKQMARIIIRNPVNANVRPEEENNERHEEANNERHEEANNERHEEANNEIPEEANNEKPEEANRGNIEFKIDVNVLRDLSK